MPEKEPTGITQEERGLCALVFFTSVTAIVASAIINNAASQENLQTAMRALTLFSLITLTVSGLTAIHLSENSNQNQP